MYIYNLFDSVIDSKQYVCERRFVMLKRIGLFIILALFAGALAGCGGGSPLSSISGGSNYDNILTDKAAAKKAVEDMKAKAGGEPLMIFQYAHFGPEFISFNRQDQKKKENIDGFTWNKGQGWSGPKAVKITGSGKLEDNLFNADQVNWEAIPDFVANAKKKAEAEGMEKAKFGSVMVQLNVHDGSLELNITAKTERKEANIEGDVKTGAVTSFRFR